MIRWGCNVITVNIVNERRSPLVSGFKITYDVTAEPLGRGEVKVVSEAPDSTDRHKRYTAPHLHIDGIDVYNVVVRSRPKDANVAEVTITGGCEFGLGHELARALKSLAESHSALYAKKSPRKDEPNHKRKIVAVEEIHICEGGF
jgi:hypothetical protein